jgi:UDP-glucose 4-epimerase
VRAALLRRLTTALITGAGGYVGGRLTAELLERGWEARAVVREPAPWLPIEQAVCDLASDDSRPVLAGLLEGVDAVVHLAGETEVTAAQTPAAALATTIAATERVAEACASSQTARLVYLSTMHVYGARIAPGATLTEDLCPEPRSAYAISRLASEHVAASLAPDRYELVVLRLTNSVGAPYDPAVDRWTLVANDLARQGTVTGRLELRSSGVQWRDFVPLGDVCSAVATACEPDGRLPPGTYNVGSGQPLTVRALAGMVQDAFERLTGTRPELRAPEPSGEAPVPYRVSVARAADHGVRLDGSLEDAITETVSFCTEHFG